MKKVCLFVSLLIVNCIFLAAKSEEPENKFEDILQETTNKILEKKIELGKKTSIIESGEIKFKVKRANLWFKEKSQDQDQKQLSEFVEIFLPGKLYTPGKEITTIEKKDVDRSIIENAVASVFSANRAGKLDWIVDNFIDKDKAKVKSLFKNKKILEASQTDSQKIVAVYLIGQADYKDSVLVFIEQDYIDGRRVKESIALKDTESGWKVTNEFSNDETFDIVFAALSSGEISLKEKESSEKEPPKDSKS